MVLPALHGGTAAGLMQLVVALPPQLFPYLLLWHVHHEELAAVLTTVLLLAARLLHL